MAKWLAIGLSWSLGATPVDEVNPGYFRSSLLVILGLLAVAAVSSWESLAGAGWTLLVVCGVLCYVSFLAFSLSWLRGGKLLLIGLGLAGAALIAFGTRPTEIAPSLQIAHAFSGAALLGVSMGAMLLGHYYLTAPWMSLAPLRRLDLAIGVAALVHGLIAGIALSLLLGQETAGIGLGEWILYFALRWGIGLVGPIVLAVLVWQTVRIKATQAATGILYVIVIFVLLGEATGIAFARFAGTLL